MRTLNYIVLGFTPMLTAVAVAQALNAGMKDSMVVLAQAGGQVGGQTPATGGAPDMQRPGEADRMNPGTPGDPMATGKDKQKGGYHMRSRSSSSKPDPMHDRSPQASKDKKPGSTDTGE